MAFCWNAVASSAEPPPGPLFRYGAVRVKAMRFAALACRCRIL
jgi:hypothetical protein